MYHDNQRLATKLYEILDDLIIENDKGEEISIDKLLDGRQKYSIIMSIIRNLPRTDFQQVLDFQDKFKVKKERTHVIENFTEKELRFSLILEETLELGFGLGIDKNTIYTLFASLYIKNRDKKITPSLIEVLDALTDILYVTYGAIDVFNLTDVQYDAMQEVHSSNMSKLIPNTMEALAIIKQTVKEYKDKGVNVISKNLKNNYIAICDANTDKILKPTTYKEPDLKTIIINHFKN